MDLLEQQKVLQQEAEQIIESTGLLEELGKYGQVEVVGSVALGLMTWKDIDIEITGDVSTADFMKVVENLLLMEGMIDLSLQDTRDSKVSGMTKGFYIGARYTTEQADKWDLITGRAKQRAWKMDFWFVKPEDSMAVQKTKELKDRLNEENRLVILGIKEYMAKHPFYRKKVYSVDIYKAVMDDGVVDFEGFKIWVKNKLNLELD